ncbi:hypothetical protein SAMN05421821_101257 [Mucilaginibacter lappiensis]|uniref:Uncharacterized protein n=1 Tax=Mucilaginibacter lappiensis TaxID=354630 RepID=A0ABR6PDI6_9SPHI|nr:hypothetical protein [Mucilaginibacter lappiensis]MBB6107830.1 hypothetical protein [Mucilaginibacter lappiensis]SIP95690.1 hypothetical protein SAMN05421821_101257 [Mucilaginibacter lappiensis]
MRSLSIAVFLLIGFQRAGAQEYVIDYQHLVAVSQNSVVRSGAETTHDQYLGKINNNINNLNTNVGSVILAQTMIYNGLANVNSALKDGLAVKNMAVIIADMTGYINQALEMAKTEPYLLVFAGNITSEMRTRSLALVTDVSGYILKEGNNVLADYNSRDKLLRKVITQLQILDGLAYGTWKAMYWAKQRGMIASLNPFANFINQDTRIVDQIIQNAKYLK